MSVATAASTIAPCAGVALRGFLDPSSPAVPGPACEPKACPELTCPEVNLSGVCPASPPCDVPLVFQASVALAAVALVGGGFWLGRRQGRPALPLEDGDFDKWADSPPRRARISPARKLRKASRAVSGGDAAGSRCAGVEAELRRLVFE